MSFNDVPNDLNVENREIFYTILRRFGTSMAASNIRTSPPLTISELLILASHALASAASQTVNIIVINHSLIRIIDHGVEVFRISPNRAMDIYGILEAEQARRGRPPAFSRSRQ